MVGNIKTEIIYYCGPTDFEFEFNLNGSCHMRLLTSIANDNNSLLKALQRSITRSKVILIIGEIKGENGIISLVSKSIGYSTESLDTDIYNAKNAEDATIVSGSVPLITSGGDFGGCIIESGPQSMIFLTEDKKIRKQLMNELVHAYINDLSRYPTEIITEAAPTIVEVSEEVKAEPAEEAVIEEPQEIIEQAEVATEIIEEQPESDEAAEEITEEAAEEATEISSDSHIIDPYNIDNIVKKEVGFEDLLEPTVYEDDEYDAPKGPKHLKSNKVLDIVSLIIAFLLLIILAFVVYSFVYLPLVNGIPLMENLKDTFAFLNL